MYWWAFHSKTITWKELILTRINLLSILGGRKQKKAKKERKNRDHNTEWLSERLCLLFHSVGLHSFVFHSNTKRKKQLHSFTFFFCISWKLFFPAFRGNFFFDSKSKKQREGLVWLVKQLGIWSDGKKQVINEKNNKYNKMASFAQCGLLIWSKPLCLKNA